MTVTGFELAVLPATSVAEAVKVLVPRLRFSVLVNELPVAVPRKPPLRLNLAPASVVNVSVTLDSLVTVADAVSVTVGGLVSTVTVEEIEVALPALSLPVATTVCLPSAMLDMAALNEAIRLVASMVTVALRAKPFKVTTTPAISMSSEKVPDIEVKLLTTAPSAGDRLPVGEALSTKVSLAV